MVTHLDLAKGIALGTGINGLKAISSLSSTGALPMHTILAVVPKARLLRV
jgi:hypothetical protein